jgi:hypothetical protein
MGAGDEWMLSNRARERIIGPSVRCGAWQADSYFAIGYACLAPYVTGAVCPMVCFTGQPKASTPEEAPVGPSAVYPYYSEQGRWPREASG